MSAQSPTALIAEDEPLLALNLVAELRKAWPELQIVATVGHGEAAVEKAMALRPDVLFLDIRMPGMTGLDAAEALTEDWPDGEPLPLIVFVTAYEQYAVQAFERSAADYVLKPVQPERLLLTCTRLQTALQHREETLPSPGQPMGVEAPAPDEMLERLRQLLGAGTAALLAGNSPQGMNQATPSMARLNVIQASVGAAIHMVPVADVVYFEAADKYVRVITADREYLIRTSLKTLIPQLDASRFWQIHRGTLVRDDAIATATRDDAGKVTLTLKGLPERLAVSRLYAPRFKAM
ncbi:LytTR family DNA-binding domain-containing protein [soil metagenome]